MCPLSPLLFSIIFKVQPENIDKKINKKRHTMKREEVQQSLFANDMILNIENPKESIQKMARINKFVEVVGDKFNTEKLVVSIHQQVII